MKLHNAFAAVLAVSMLGLAACSKPSVPDDTLPKSDASATAPAAAPKPVQPTIGDGSNEVADFTVDPGQVFNCEGRDRATSKVKWSVKDPTVVTVKILVGDKSSAEKKTFAAGANIGEAMTGDWVGAGVTFFLVDGKDDKMLASYEVPLLPCN